MLKNVICGAITLIVGIVYIIEARRLPESSLSDEIGASGFPLLIGWALVALSVFLIGQSVLFRRQVQAEEAPSEDSVWNDPKFAAKRAAGLAAIAVAFLVLLPMAGYISALVVLIGASALYLGRPPGRDVAIVAVGGAIALWLLFVVILDIPLPAGIFEGLL